MTRQIVLDTETTGLKPEDGHRIIEIGCVELVNRELTGNNYHVYINPERPIDEGALAVHGISQAFLADKPIFNGIAIQFLEYVADAELIIHNAPFDVGFINHEFNLSKQKLGKLENHCKILDTLAMARKMHPGQRNSLDALCKRYQIDNSHRDLHGALLDAEILGLVYLAMTGGQFSLFESDAGTATERSNTQTQVSLQHHDVPMKIIQADAHELKAHESFIDTLDKESGGKCLWKTDS